jgi:hypothetical protein
LPTLFKKLISPHKLKFKKLIQICHFNVMLCHS